MSVNQFIFIDEGFGQQFSRVFMELMLAKAPFPAKGTSWQELSTVLEEIKPNPDNLVIAVESAFWQNSKKSVEGHLKKYFKTIIEVGMEDTSSLGLLYKAEALFAKQSCFVFFSNTGLESQVLNFIMFVGKIFNELILMQRLMGYIYSTFEGVVDSELLKKKQKEVEVLNKELEYKSRTDNLTKLYNRNALYGFMKNFENISLLMLDVDDFKKINDTHGHLAGDDVLRTIGKYLMDSCIFRKSDMAGRFGGEEFVVIFPQTRVKDVYNAAVRFSQELKAHTFTGSNDRTFRVTISVGLAEYRKGDATADNIIQRADLALYYAKEHGKDQIVIFDDVEADIKNAP